MNSRTDYIQPKVTDYMDHIISYIQLLVDKGYAYEIDGDVYFRVNNVKEYGRLSNRVLEDMISGSRIEVNNKKENPLDFTLWKKTKVGIKFDSPFGEGRPGWHTECVAMIDDVFGELDPRRRNALMNLLPADTQKLVTTTNLDWWDGGGLELELTTVKDGLLLEE